MCFYRKEMCPKRLTTFAKSHQWEVFKCIKYNFQRVCCTLYSKIHRLYSNFIPTHQALALCSNVVLVPPHVAFAVEPWQVNALMVGSVREEIWVIWVLRTGKWENHMDRYSCLQTSMALCQLHLGFKQKQWFESV